MALFLGVSVLGIAGNGFENRVSADVRALDNQRRPLVPFQQCNGKVDGCPIGQPGRPGDGDRIVFWGDSHMLAWAPAIDRILKDHGTSARLVWTSACPAILDVSNDSFPDCERQNARIERTIANADVVVMASSWNGYKDKPVRVNGSDPLVLEQDLARTIAHLNHLGKQVYLLGPVPTYELNVPYYRALKHMQGQASNPPMTSAVHYEKSQVFLKAEKYVASPHTLIDPAQWMCTPDCEIGQSATSFYRDSNHLSVDGALHYADKLAVALAPAFSAARGAKELRGH